jgi:hypothetical protein
MVAPIRFLSGRQQQQKIGVIGSTEDTKVLEVIGRVGIGSINPTADLDVVGLTELDNLNVSGIATVGTFGVSGLTTTTNLNVVGLSTFESNVDINASVDISNNLTVDGLSDLDELNVAGIATFRNNIEFFGPSSVQLTWDSVEDILKFKDDVSAHFGDGDDLKIFHNGSDSFISDAGTGNLRLISDGLGVVIQKSGTESIANFNTDGSVELYYDNSKKFETTGYGVTVSGGLIVSGVSTFASSVDINAGLDVDGLSDLDELNVAGIATFNTDVEFVGPTAGITSAYWDSSANLLNFKDNVKATFGDGGDLEIYHAESASRIVDTSGTLVYRSASHRIKNQGGIEDLAVFTEDAAVELYYDNSKKFETTGIGVSIVNGTSDTATITGPENLIIDPAAVGDNTGIVRIKGDLYVDGTTTQINSTTIELADFIVGIATTATSDLLADGAGIQIGPDNTFLYEYNSGTNPSLKSSENLNVASGKVYQIGEIEVLNATTLGSGVTISSLTQVGTINTGVWQGTQINDDYLGTIDNANKVSLSALNIDGGTDIGSTLSDGDLFIVDDGGNGTNRKANVIGITTYVFGKVSGDILISSTGIATIQENSVGLGTDTFGDYVKSITGTTNEVEVTSGSGEGSTPQIGLPNVVAITSSLTVGSATTITGSGIIAGIVTGTLNNTLTLATSGTGLSGSTTYNNSGAATFTVTSDATSANTAGTIVARDGSGNFSAGTITANLTGTATTANNLSDAANITTGTINDARLPDLITSNINISSGISSVATLDATNATIDNLTFTSGTAITSVDTDLAAVSGSDNTLASAKAIKTYVDAQVTAQDLDIQGDTGGALSIDLDSEVLTIAGTASEIETVGSGNTITIGLPNQVAITTSLVVGSGVTITGSTVQVGGTLNVAGISTFASDVDINASIDVDGHTELDDLNVSGVSTFVGVGTFQSDLYVGGNFEVAGTSEFIGVVTFRGGTINIGDSDTDDVVVGGEFASNLVPTDDGQYDLGTSGKQWRDLYITGTIDTDQLNVSGLSTFASDVDINADLDVDGFTELDATNISETLNVVGLSTFGSNVDINASVDISGNLDVHTDLDVDGYTELDATNISETLNVVGLSTFGSNVDINADLDVDGFTELDATNISETLNVVGLSTFGSNVDINAGLDVDGLSDLDELNVAGLSTFASAVDINADLDVDGRTELDTTNISETLNVVGLTTLGSNVDINADLDVDGRTELDDLNVSGVSTFASNVDINAGLDVDGHTELDNLNVTGVATFTSNVNISTGELHGPAEFIIDPAAVGDNTGLVRIKGDLYVDGTTTQINSTTIEFADFNVGIATTVGTNLLLDGAGISIGSASVEKTFTYNNSANTLESSIGLGVTTGGDFKTGTDSVLNRTTLGPTVVNSSLTSVGTLTEVEVSGISTFASDVDINASVDISTNLVVDGLSDLDELNVAGISTFASDLDINASVDISNNLVVDGLSDLDELNVAGISTFQNNIEVTGNIEFDNITTTGAATATLTTLTETPIHTGLSASTYRSVEYTIQATEGTNFHSAKVLVVHDGTTAYHSEYGTIYNNTPVATFNADVSGGNLRLLAAGESSNSTVYKIHFIATKV